MKIDRRANSISLTSSSENGSLRSDKTMDAHAVLGIITLHTSDFLIVITAKKQVATLLGAAVYLATDFRVLPIDSDANRNSTMQHPIEKTLLGLLKTHLYSAPFYFSYDYDLTSSMQRQAKQGGKGGAANLPSIWKRADDRFFWNRHLQTRLIELTESGTAGDFSRFIQPVVFGFLEIKSATVNGRDFVFGLVARRSRFRAGTRYFSRGIDKDGHVSNFNETEQFVLLDQAPSDGKEKFGKTKGEIRLSYIQTRGSVPVFWAEVNNLRYKPDLLVMEKPETVSREFVADLKGKLLNLSFLLCFQLEAAQLHFQEQTSIYGDVYLVNLVNQAGYEKPIKEAYERLVEKLRNPQVHYTYYDFHHECKGMKFERVMGLVDTMNQKGLENDE